MKDEDKYNKWTKFMSDYGEYFLSMEISWNNKLNDAIEYIKINNKKPSKKSKDKKIQELGNWISDQITSHKESNFNGEENNSTNILNTNKEIFDKWENFINTPDKFFVPILEQNKTNC
jgi:hypothetical protein